MLHSVLRFRIFKPLKIEVPGSRPVSILGIKYETCYNQTAISSVKWSIKREDCHSVVVNSYERPQNFSNIWNGLVRMLRSTFAEEFLGLNIQWNLDLKRLWRDIFNSGGPNGRLSVLSADVNWKCKLFPVEISMYMSRVCLNWVRSMESKTNLLISDGWLESILRYCTDVSVLFTSGAMFCMRDACCYASEYNL